MLVLANGIWELGHGLVCFGYGQQCFIFLCSSRRWVDYGCYNSHRTLSMSMTWLRDVAELRRGLFVLYAALAFYDEHERLGDDICWSRYLQRAGMNQSYDDYLSHHDPLAFELVMQMRGPSVL